MKNRDFGDMQQPLLSDEPLTQGAALTAVRRKHHPGEALTVMTLTEPRFQDLNQTSRFFMDYCELLPCLASGATC